MLQSSPYLRNIKDALPYFLKSYILYFKLNTRVISLRNNKLNLEKVFREHIWGNSCFLYKVNFKKNMHYGNNKFQRTTGETDR